MNTNDFLFHKYIYDTGNEPQGISSNPDLRMYKTDKDEKTKYINSKSPEATLYVKRRELNPSCLSDATHSASVSSRAVRRLDVNVKQVKKNGGVVETLDLLNSDFKELLRDLFNKLVLVDTNISLKPFKEHVKQSYYMVLEKMIEDRYGACRTVYNTIDSIMLLYITEIAEIAPTVDDFIKCLESVNLYAASRLLKDYFETGYEPQGISSKPDLRLSKPDKDEQKKYINSKSLEATSYEKRGELNPSCLSDATHNASVSSRDVRRLDVNVKQVKKSGGVVETLDLLNSDFKELLRDLFNKLVLVDGNISLKPFEEHVKRSYYMVLQRMIEDSYSKYGAVYKTIDSIMRLYITKIADITPTVGDFVKCLESVNLYAASILLKDYFEAGYEPQGISSNPDLRMYKTDKDEKTKYINSKSWEAASCVKRGEFNPPCLSDVTHSASVSSRAVRRLDATVKQVKKNGRVVEILDLLNSDFKELLRDLFNKLVLVNTNKLVFVDSNIILKPFEEHVKQSYYMVLQKMIECRYSKCTDVNTTIDSIMQLYITEIAHITPTVGDLAKCLEDVDIYAASRVLIKGCFLNRVVSWHGGNCVDGYG